MSSMKFWLPLPVLQRGQEGEGSRKLCGKTENNKRAGSCILAIKRKWEFECIC